MTPPEPEDRGRVAADGRARLPSGRRVFSALGEEALYALRSSENMELPRTALVAEVTHGLKAVLGDPWVQWEAEKAMRTWVFTGTGAGPRYAEGGGGHGHKGTERLPGQLPRDRAGF